MTINIRLLCVSILYACVTHLKQHQKTVKIFAEVAIWCKQKCDQWRHIFLNIEAHQHTLVGTDTNNKLHKEFPTALTVCLVQSCRASRMGHKTEKLWTTFILFTFLHDTYFFGPKTAERRTYLTTPTTNNVTVTQNTQLSHTRQITNSRCACHCAFGSVRYYSVIMVKCVCVSVFWEHVDNN